MKTMQVAEDYLQIVRSWAVFSCFGFTTRIPGNIWIGCQFNETKNGCTSELNILWMYQLVFVLSATRAQHQTIHFLKPGSGIIYRIRKACEHWSTFVRRKHSLRTNSNYFSQMQPILYILIKLVGIGSIRFVPRQ